MERKPKKINELNQQELNGESKPTDVKKEVFEWIKSLGFAVVAAVLITRYVFTFTVVDGESMFPTLHNKDRLIELKIDKYIRSYSYGDIVVIKDKVQTMNNYYVKRIIAMPGDTIKIYAGNVYLNGSLLQEPYIYSTEFGTQGDLEVTLKEDEYFVMGDNRKWGASRDSRIFGPVKKKSIGGRCVIIMYPLDRIGELK
ncbi:MAG: signal peptidase I [Tissierellia bacterium]|nr:signal peptidase I [Tissierellia bacterium]